MELDIHTFLYSRLNLIVKGTHTYYDNILLQGERLFNKMWVQHAHRRTCLVQLYFEKINPNPTS